ncbi:hypothetical protein J6590_037626 [Homalodisca vitripennis]|nr:hypothetical protein J6590_037626 [Homalodisca vitripennis]
MAARPVRICFKMKCLTCTDAMMRPSVHGHPTCWAFSLDVLWHGRWCVEVLCPQEHCYPATLTRTLHCALLASCINSPLTQGLDKWQHTISSGFDRLVAFASTELDKRRRSTEGGGGGVSCNTSPDSGIGHGDPPPAPPPALLTKMPRLYRPSPPPVLEAGPPRTPSPSSPPPPLLSLDGPYSPVPPPSPPPLAPSVPLRYQRGDHHFKKKFLHHKGRFRPKGKGWDWHHTADESWC